MKHPQTGICREGCPFLALVAFSALLFALLGLWLPALAFLLVLWLSSHFSVIRNVSARKRDTAPLVRPTAESCKSSKPTNRSQGSASPASASS